MGFQPLKAKAAWQLWWQEPAVWDREAEFSSEPELDITFKAHLQ